MCVVCFDFGAKIFGNYAKVGMLLQIDIVIMS